jgi:hypothetical protein
MKQLDDSCQRYSVNTAAHVAGEAETNRRRVLLGVWQRQEFWRRQVK